MRKALIGFLMAGAAALPSAALAQEVNAEAEVNHGDSHREVQHTPRMESPRMEAQARRDSGDNDARQQRAAERYERLERQNQERYGGSSDAARAQGDAAPAHWGGRDRDRNRSRQPTQSDQDWQGDPNDPRMERYRQRYSRTERENQRRYSGDHDRWDDRRDRRWDDRRDQRRWDRDWRRDSRYDWARYRSRYGDLFRTGHYSDPYGHGYGYRRVGIGFRLGSPFYSSRYWIRDPWRYRLPQAYPGMQWVRYYDDVLLVDTFTGQVVDVIHNFFW